MPLVQERTLLLINYFKNKVNNIYHYFHLELINESLNCVRVNFESRMSKDISGFGHMVLVTNKSSVAIIFAHLFFLAYFIPIKNELRSMKLKGNYFIVFE